MPNAMNSTTPLPLLEEEVRITTPDGQCDAFVAAPATGRHPAVLIWPDIFGLRTTYRNMARKLASSGYLVLVVNPFYRELKAPTAPAGTATPMDVVRAQNARLTPTMQFVDAASLTSWLRAHSSVDTGRKMGVCGYCMGGSPAIRTAAAASDHIGALGIFHGGGLVTPGDDSPHLLIERLKASTLVAIAQNDDEAEPHAKHALRKAFDDAQLHAEIEVYPAAHGWCPPDMRAHNAEQSERAWVRWLEHLATL
jgi:carboxymethylenebutenolidase